IAEAFEGTGWAKDATYQIGSAYWRLGQYSNAEKAYLDYIERFGARTVQEGATRNLIDVYRALGENAKAKTLLDRTLAKRLSTPTRQSLLFTKAKILYSQKKYTRAVEIFRQLGRTRIQAGPGNTSKDEVRYFEAMSLARAGNTAGAKTIWKNLAL